MHFSIDVASSWGDLPWNMKCTSLQSKAGQSSWAIISRINANWFEAHAKVILFVRVECNCDRPIRTRIYDITPVVPLPLVIKMIFRIGEAAASPYMDFQSWCWHLSLCSDVYCSYHEDALSTQWKGGHKITICTFHCPFLGIGPLKEKSRFERVNPARALT